MNGINVAHIFVWRAMCTSVHSYMYLHETTKINFQFLNAFRTCLGNRLLSDYHEKKKNEKKNNNILSMFNKFVMILINVSRVCYKVRIKPAYSATEAS